MEVNSTLFPLETILTHWDYIGPVGGFISLFSILPHHLKYDEIMDETTPTMQDFNFGVFYMLITFNCKTHNDLETVYVGFHLDETPSISLFFKSLPCHPNYLCGN